MSGMKADEFYLNVQIEPLEEGGYLVTSSDLPGLVAACRDRAASLRAWEGRDSNAEWSAQWWFADAASILQPILDAANGHAREVHWVLLGIIRAEDRRPDTAQFWSLWELFAELAVRYPLIGGPDGHTAIHGHLKGSELQPGVAGSGGVASRFDLPN